MDLVLLGSLVPGIENHSLTVLQRAAESEGYRAALIPLSGLAELGAALDSVLRLAPRLCDLSMQSTEGALVNLCFARLLRKRGYSGRIVCGGHFATLNAEDLLAANAGIDFVVQFAGEQVLAIARKCANLGA